MTNNKDNLTMLQRIEVYAENVRTLYTEAVDELLRIARKVKSLKDDEVFSFDDKKAMREQSQAVIRRLHALTVAAIEQGIELEWEEANKALDLLTTMKFGKQILDQPQFVDWFQRNTSAMQAFINRRNNGMNLSDRVWKYSNQLKSELEMALTVSIGEGNSAGTISRRVRHLLNQPDKLFRRVRDKATGNLKLSKAAQAYNPGRGIYRSSAKNAMRLARTETNMAYRNSDYTRRQQLDFVIGQKIFLSRSHPEYDICDELEGEYPKDFVFSGWHPQCFCVCTSILMSRKEMHEAYLAKKQGKEYKSKNEIKDYPKNFKDWVKEHKDDIAVWRSKNKEPYFLRENKEAIDGILKPKEQKPLTHTFNYIKLATQKKILYNEVKPLDKKLTESEIIHKISGYDTTKGSCNSLAFAYIGNKYGLDVLDFRGGESCKIFSQRLLAQNLRNDIGGIVDIDRDDYASKNLLLNKMESEKEYLLIVAKHAAIVRKSGKQVEYLELQSAIQNGFLPLTNAKFEQRFEPTRSKYVSSNYLFDIELFKDNDDFRKLLGYINTEPKKQKRKK